MSGTYNALYIHRGVLYTNNKQSFIYLDAVCNIESVTMKAIKVNRKAIAKMMIPLRGGGVRDPTTTYKGRNKFALHPYYNGGD